MTTYVETDFSGDEYPLNNVRIGYESPDGTASASSGSTGLEAVNATYPTTIEFWQADSVPASWVMTFDSAEIVSYFGIAYHDLGTQNAVISLQTSVDSGSSWQDVAGLASITPSDDESILFLFDPIEVDAIRLYIASADSVPFISVMRAGPVLEWPHPCTWTGTPPTEGDTLTYTENTTDTGGFSGRSLVSDGLTFSVEVDHMSETFRTGDFKAFKSHCNKGDATFWVSVRAGDYPDEIAYAKSPDAITMSRNIPNYRVSGSTTISCRGFKALG